MGNEELFQELWENEEVWNEFVKSWMKRNPDKIIKKDTSSIQEEYADFINKKIEDYRADEIDRAMYLKGE